MANGRALPSALLFDWLLMRAWSMAQGSINITDTINLEKFGRGSLEQLKPMQPASMEKFISKYKDEDTAKRVKEHDEQLSEQLSGVATEWAKVMGEAVSKIQSVSPGVAKAVEWLSGVASTGRGLGSLGQKERAAALASHVESLLALANPRGIYVPRQHQEALGKMAESDALVYTAMAGRRMDADRVEQEHKLQVDAVVMLLQLRNDAMSALAEHAFIQMHLMFDVFGRNNEYLRAMRRAEDGVRRVLNTATTSLAGWKSRLDTTADSLDAAHKVRAEFTGRGDALDAMQVDAMVSQLKRYSSRAAAALNSVGVSVNSTAGESNTIDGGA